HPIVSRFRQTVEVLLKSYFIAATLSVKLDQSELRAAINKVSREYSFLLNSDTIVAFANSITEGKKYELVKKIEFLSEKTARQLALNMQDVIVKQHSVLEVYNFAR